MHPTDKIFLQIYVTAMVVTFCFTLGLQHGNFINGSIEMLLAASIFWPLTVFVYIVAAFEAILIMNLYIISTIFKTIFYGLPSLIMG